ncbi:TonB-dependent receptor [Zobellia galactanivorans]|uniref:TonB-dependent receptor n=1 Tax=Zobellia galactanivorans (strain DSM 12802 / CCUG 47099 / CIP 106680 / NCIMB 13871 / Dsij) TaxID=63186 RepID=UPI0002FFE3B1|nr:TonB-dependent receptor [Zobellia galactanivorans]
MKNYLKGLRVSERFIPPKIVLIVKLSIILICLSSFAAIPTLSYAQKTKLTLEVANSPIKDVLRQIENKSDFFFLYNDNLIDVEKKVSINVTKRRISDILKLVFNDDKVVYSVVNKQIILSPKSMVAAGAMQMQAQGVVYDEFGVALPGVSIVLKGTSKGTQTDFDGNFVIEATSGDILVFTYLGMKSQEIVVSDQNPIQINMEPDALGLDEIVVVGYGVSKKSDLTGAVASVDVEQLSSIPNVSVLQAMQGSVAGLNIGAVDAAGEDPSISIRGQNSLSSNSSANSPLIVVDGIIYRGNLVDLNKADIASIDVLKDASSAAIYGSQAANGVLLITTKKGKVVGKPTINYSASYTVQTPTNTALEPMKATELKEFLPDAYWQTGSRIGPDYLESDPNFDITSYFNTPEMVEGYENGTDGSLYDILTGDGYINTHNLSVTGRSENFGYFFSGGFTDVKGFAANDTYKKVNYRMNLDAEINDWLSVGTETFITTSDYSGETPRIATASLVHPWTPLYEEDGSPRQTLQGTWFNPLLDLEADDDDKRLNLFANIHADVKLPIKGLNYRMNFSQNYRTINHNNFDANDANFTGYGYKNASIYYDWTLDNILSYNRTFNEVHNISATFLYGVEERNYSFTNVNSQNFTNDLLGYNSLEAGDPTLYGMNTGKEREQSLYTMGRLQYNYNSKYLVTGTIRRDGFSGFGTNDKLGVFPSVALGWVVSEENFVNTDSKWLNYLKLRGSYGTTGRRGLGRYDTQAVVSTSVEGNNGYIFGDGGSPTQVQWISSLANNNLGWETTTGLNVGADFAFFNSRLSGNVEYYNNSTKDILYAIQLPTTSGFSSINTNIGEVANHGIEFSLTGKWINNQDLSWSTTVNYSRNRNEIVSILGADNDGDGLEDDLVSNTLFIGEPTDVVYDYEIIGMWQLADEEAGNIPNGFYPGTYKIADLNDDGAYSANDDKKILGYKDPGYRFGIANTVKYKQFSLYAFINSIQGGDDYYFGTDALIFGATNTSIERYSVQNIPTGAWDYWMPENPDARFRRLDGPAGYEPNRYLQRNFVRIQDVSLSYDFDKKILGKIGFSSLRLFVSGKNLHTFTKWRGWDPETGGEYTWGVNPVMANYTLGLNVEF